MIICFSGTGNTAIAARALASHFCNERVLMLSAEQLLYPTTSILETDDSRIVWAFPTYAWGIPPVVERFIKGVTLKCSASAKHYMLTTCGDDMGYTDRQWRKIIAKRGFSPIGAYAVRMPNTYVFLPGFDVDSKDLAAQKLNDAPARIEAIALSIKNDGSDLLIPGAMPWLKSAIIRPFFNKFLMNPKKFGVNDGCTSCGACSRVCPMQNITINSDGPSWRNNCAFCLRCYHSCPRHAITYGKSTNGKGTYLAPKI